MRRRNMRLVRYLVRGMRDPHTDTTARECYAICLWRCGKRKPAATLRYPPTGGDRVYRHRPERVIFAYLPRLSKAYLQKSIPAAAKPLS